MDEKSLWYWQYEITVFNDEDYSPEIRGGVVSGCDWEDVVRQIKAYYGEDMEEITLLKPLSDIVLEFQQINDEPTCNFRITMKEDK